jgi:hypothetical protein
MGLTNCYIGLTRRLHAGYAQVNVTMPVYMQANALQRGLSAMCPPPNAL